MRAALLMRKRDARVAADVLQRGDVDNDGDLDLFVIKVSNTQNVLNQSSVPTRHFLYINGVDGNWNEAAVSRGCSLSGRDPTGYAASFGDYDLDGQLDLTVSQWNLNSVATQNTRICNSLCYRAAFF
jgi:hypothetical protein